MSDGEKHEKTPGRSMTGVMDEWEVEAVWEPLQSGDLPRGPTTMTITLSPNASPKSRQRGINSGVMRRIERLLADFTSEMEQRDRASAVPTEQEANEMFLEALGREVAALPEGGPRSKTGDYYGGLLEIYETLEAVQPDPMGDLATLMGVPLNTVKSQIYRAKKAKEAGRG